MSLSEKLIEFIKDDNIKGCIFKFLKIKDIINIMMTNS